MQFMDNHTRGDKLNKYRATVQLGADHSAYTDTIPSNGVAIGTVTIRDHSGALVYLHDIGFIMITPNRVHRLDDRKTSAAILEDFKQRNLELALCTDAVRDAIERAEVDFQRFKQQRYEKMLQDRQRETERQRQERQKQKQD